MKVSFNWLKDYVRIKSSSQATADQLTMAGLEVKKIDTVSGDAVFETEITTNRPDWLSHLGVAREIHAITGNRFIFPPFLIRTRQKTEQSFRVSVADPGFCPYYSATLIEEIKWVETPDFIKRRLEACGIRSINLIVDITNYVLLEWGQPLHAFDADHLRGNIIAARRAQPGEKLVAIDGFAYELMKDDLVIADANGPVAIGGIMGGKESEVNEGVKNILLESAFFAPERIRATVRRLGLASESSYRFERRVDPEGVDQARERATFLIAKYAHPKRISSVFRAGKLPAKERKISFAHSEVKQILGVDIPPAKAKRYLSRLGLRVSGKGERASIQVPSFRPDLSRSVDLIEEIARIYGYDRIPETLPIAVPLAPRVDPILDLERKVRDLCTGFGLQEVINFSLVDSASLEKLGLSQDKWVRLVNPQNKELNLMRPNLLSGLLTSVRRNFYIGQLDIKVFEVGKRYLDQTAKALPVEERMLAIACSGEKRGNWLEKKRSNSFYDLKGMVDALIHRLGIDSVESAMFADSIFQPGEGILLATRDQELCFYGALSDRVRKVYDVDKPVYYAELNLEKVVSLAKRSKTMQEIPKFPFSPRDLTVIVQEDLKAEVITERIRQMAGQLISNIEVLDYFKGGQIPRGKKSLAYHITYQAHNQTLTSEMVDAVHNKVESVLKKQYKADVRR